MTSDGTHYESITAIHNGIQYTGEMVRASAWDASFGLPLVGDRYFRVVFLEAPAVLSASDIRDSRIAVYVPGPRTAGLERAEAQLRTMREAQGLHASESETRDALDSEVREIEERAVEEWTESFRHGHLVTAPPLTVDLEAVFEDGYWSAWGERIAVKLLARTYEESLIDAALIMGALRPDLDAPMLFEAVTGAQGDLSNFVMEAFAWALGIAQPASARTLDLSACPALNVIESAIGETRPGELGHLLAHEHGLTYPLATLFMLLFVSMGTHRLRLDRGHGMRARDGSVLGEDMISAQTLARLAWPTELWDWVESIEPMDSTAPEPTSYMAAMGLEELAQQPESERQAALRQWADDMGRSIDTVAEALAKLAAAQGRELDGAVSAEINIMRGLLSSEPLALPGLAESAYGSAGAFANAVKLWQAWRTALRHVAPLAEAVGFLGRATVDEDRSDLFMEREVLREQLLEPRLLSAPQQWGPLVEGFERFRRGYVAAYLRHHDEYHARMGALAHVMDEASAQASALARLNSLSELGAPVAADLPGLTAELRNEVIACGADPSAADIAEQVRCQACGIGLDGKAPVDEVNRLAGYVQEALGEQNRRLSTHIAHRLIQRDDQERLDRFIQVVEVSDLAGLAHVLDDELTSFVGALLREPASGDQKRG